MPLVQIKDLEIANLLNEGTANIQGNTTVGGTLAATGNTTLGGTLTATGNTNLLAGTSGNVGGVPWAPIRISENYAMTSVQASAATVARITVMRAVTIQDWNVQVLNGATCTGAGAFVITLNRSLAGTGANAAIGTATIAGTAANDTVVDATVVTGTGANMAAGDDIVIATVAGTALPADAVRFNVYVDAIQRLV